VKPDSNPLNAIQELDANVLINSCPAIWQCLNVITSTTPTSNGIVEIICDNAGYELFTDFILAEYLIDQNLASKVRFNVKAIPWYISDVIPKDFQWAIRYLKTHKNSLELRQLGEKWNDYVTQGKFELAPIEYFWTSPYEYYRMANVNPTLHNRLAEAQLLIFKGDLNYRKLLGDFNWDYTEDFIKCLRGFRPTNLCTLRTVKADLICGLTNEKIEQLFQLDSEWMYTGDYGVIQFAAKHSPSNNENDL